MEITSAEFVRGIIGTSSILEEKKPTIAFFGRSNTGKSSVINSLVQRKNLVRSSSTPGQTRQINYFSINKRWYFADTPGYGYAKAPASSREKIGKLLAWYMTSEEVMLDKAVLIVDVNVGLKESDFQILNLLLASGKRVVIVANKIDKSGKNEVRKQLILMQKAVGDCILVPYSAKTKTGREDLLRLLLGE